MACAWAWHVDQAEMHTPSVLTVKYEDLVSAPATEIGSLSRFIGIDLDYEQICRDARGVLKRSNSSFGEEIVGVSQRSVKRWQSGSPSWMSPVIEALTARSMERYGYSPMHPKRSTATSRMLTPFVQGMYRAVKLGRRTMFPIVRR